MRTYKYSKEFYLDYPIGATMANNKRAINELISIWEYKCKLPVNKVVNIICRGSSGAIIAAAFAMRIDNPVNIVYVRKPGEQKECHSEPSSDLRPLYKSNAHNIIVDDFISSGSTIIAIKQFLNENDFSDTVIHGIVVTGGLWYHTEVINPQYFITCK